MNGIKQVLSFSQHESYSSEVQERESDVEYIPIKNEYFRVWANKTNKLKFRTYFALISCILLPTYESIYRGDVFKHPPPEISLNANKFLDFETDLGGVFKYISPVCFLSFLAFKELNPCFY